MTPSPLAEAFAASRVAASRNRQVRPLPDEEYRHDPVAWAVEVMGIREETIRWSLLPEYATHPWDGTPDPLVAMAEAIAAGHRAVGVESGAGTGKTYTLGWLVLWFVAVYKPSLVITTAPKEDQLKLQLWKEIGNHWRRFKRAYPTAETVDLRVRMDPKADVADIDSIAADAWAIVGYACGVEANQESATRAQGFHSEHMLIVTEETPGVPAPVMKAFKNTSGADHNLRLAVGNPDHQHDSLHTFCMAARATHIRISALDHPNVVCGRSVIPGATGLEAVRELADDYGVDSPMYGSRVQGISPPQAADALIQWDWLEQAAKRFAAAKTLNLLGQGIPALGVDVAQSENGDKASVAEGRGHRLLAVTARRCPNATVFGREIYGRMGRDRILPQHVGIDPVGVGAAAVNTLNELTDPLKRGRVQALNGGGVPMRGVDRSEGDDATEWQGDVNTFANLRAQMYWQLREDLRRGLADMPYDEVLFRQLTLPKSFVRAGKTYIESKDDIKKRTGGKSPDEADSVVYWNWVRPRALLPAKIAPPDGTHPGFRQTERGLRRADTDLAASHTTTVERTRPGSLVRPYGR